jgi:IS5 family transposase
MDTSTDQYPKSVRERRSEYKRISQWLENNPALLRLVHGDICAMDGTSDSGRGSEYTSENILRIMIVMLRERKSLRETVAMIGNSHFLQDFARLGNRTVMSASFLDRCFHAVNPETWKEMNDILCLSAQSEDGIEPSQIRVDSSVVEADIHYPTDAWLLWDSWRALTGLLKVGRKMDRKTCRHRFHTKKIKKLYLDITRHISSRKRSRKKQVRSRFRTLVKRCRWLVEVGEEFCEKALRRTVSELQRIAEEVTSLLPIVRTVIDTAERANIKGEKVTARERIFSIFEPHVELICKGDSYQDIKFGHVLWFSQCKGKLITDYEIMEQQKADNRLTPEVVERHEQLFGEKPDTVATDTGFNPGASQRAVLEEDIENFAVPRKPTDWGKEKMAPYQGFRAGIEATVSFLKRCFELSKCTWRGFSGYERGVGLAVFCHNLLILARKH